MFSVYNFPLFFMSIESKVGKLCITQGLTLGAKGIMNGGKDKSFTNSP